MKKGYICKGKKNEGQAQVYHLHDGPVDSGKRRQVFLPPKKPPEHEMEKGECKIVESTYYDDSFGIHDIVTPI